ncbi:hypothetical protein MFFC18_48730 [Mariniblastus fucicola]|uniref:Uncharacterized protein n=1 Tax=Mariniblastus fucicola TaxID=980251 RepID=A0A5B9PI32_9BACT|nr:hypothetical protein MFFC18_48730 [Mariniblastus fucicola]
MDLIYRRRKAIQAIGVPDPEPKDPRWLNLKRSARRDRIATTPTAIRPIDMPRHKKRRGSDAAANGIDQLELDEQGSPSQ